MNPFGFKARGTFASTILIPLFKRSLLCGFQNLVADKWIQRLYTLVCVSSKVRLAFFLSLDFLELPSMYLIFSTL